MMASVFDVARYILRRDEMTAMKLQKLVYYAQAWSLVWIERPLFPQPIEAWAGGPVCPELFARHRSHFKVSAAVMGDGDEDALSNEERIAIDTVIEFYGKHTAQWLSDLTHLERPWVDARVRAGAGPGDQCNEIITLAEMAEYYSGLMANASAEAIT
jgi:uncharacterized phage-associated protein